MTHPHWPSRRGLVKVFGETRAVDGIDLSVPAPSTACSGRTARARPRPSACWPRCCARRGLGPGPRPRRRRRGRQGGAAVSMTGQFASVDEEADRPREPGAAGPAVRVLQGPGPRAGRRAARRLRPRRGGRPAGQHLLGGMRRRLDIAPASSSPRPAVPRRAHHGPRSRSRNQVWEIVRVLVAAGTTVLLTTQYLDEADQLADRIAIIDHGRIIAEGTSSRVPGVGRRLLHVRVADPARRGRPSSCSPARWVCPWRSTPTPWRSPPGGRAGPHRPGPGRDGPGRHRRHRVRPRPAQHGRGVPVAHRPPGRRPDRDRGGRGVSTTAPTTAAEPASVAEATLRRCPPAPAHRHPTAWPPRLVRLAGHAQDQARPHAAVRRDHVPDHVHAAVHVPVRRRPGRVPREYIQDLLPGILVMTVVMITMYTGMALNTDISKGVFDRFRSLPIWRSGAGGDDAGRRPALHDGGPGRDRAGRSSGSGPMAAQGWWPPSPCCWCSRPACRGCGAPSA